MGESRVWVGESGVRGSRLILMMMDMRLEVRGLEVDAHDAGLQAGLR